MRKAETSNASIALDRDLYEALKARAADNDRSLTKEIARILRADLEKTPKKSGKQKQAI